MTSGNSTNCSVGLTTYEIVIYTAIYVVEALLAILGNLFVLLAFYRDKTLRSTRYFYIFNLCLVDFLRGVFVIPAAAAMTIDYSIVPKHMCNYVLIWAYILWNESMASIIMVTADRLYMIRYPMLYLSRDRKKNVLLIIIGSWSVSIAWNILIVFFWDYIEDVQPDSCSYCYAAYEYSKYGDVITMLEFALPMVTIACLNILVYFTIVRECGKMDVFKRRSVESFNTIVSTNVKYGSDRSLQQVQPLLRVSLKSIHTPVDGCTAASSFMVLSPDLLLSATKNNSSMRAKSLVPAPIKHDLRLDQRNLPYTSPLDGLRHRRNSYPISSSEEEKFFERTANIDFGFSVNRRRKVKFSTVMPKATSEVNLYRTMSNLTFRSVKCSIDSIISVRKPQLKRILRVNKPHSLSIIVITYMICWTPAGLLVVVKQLCDCIPGTIEAMAILLAYLDPALNPLLYGLGHRIFAKNLKEICQIIWNYFISAWNRVRKLTCQDTK